MTTEVQCIHHWKLGWNNRGTCEKCGEKRQFSYSNAVRTENGGGEMAEKQNDRMAEFHPADLTAEDHQAIQEVVDLVKSEEVKPKAGQWNKRRLTPEQLDDLMVIGPEAFVEKYGYKRQATSIFVQRYRQLGGKVEYIPKKLRAETKAKDAGHGKRTKPMLGKDPVASPGAEMPITLPKLLSLPGDKYVPLVNYIGLFDVPDEILDNK